MDLLLVDQGSGPSPGGRSTATGEASAREVSRGYRFADAQKPPGLTIDIRRVRGSLPAPSKRAPDT
jgi:hypothetical protein